MGFPTNVLVNVNGGLVVWMNSGIADAMDQLLDEIDEEESTTKEDFCRRNSAQIEGSALDTFSNLKNSWIYNAPFFLEKWKLIQQPYTYDM